METDVGALTLALSPGQVGGRGSHAFKRKIPGPTKDSRSPGIFFLHLLFDSLQLSTYDKSISMKPLQTCKVPLVSKVPSVCPAPAPPPGLTYCLSKDEPLLQVLTPLGSRHQFFLVVLFPSCACWPAYFILAVTQISMESEQRRKSRHLAGHGLKCF